jgi:hypothetical protein
VILTYTIVGSLFLPFLAGALLYLGRKLPWSDAVPKNGRATTALLVVVLLVFVLVGLKEVLDAL